MATTLQPPQTDVETETAGRTTGTGGGFRGSGAGAAICALVKDSSGEPTRTGIWVGLSAIAMMFAALTSALYVREGSATDWHHIVLPPILWFNTLALLASSVTLEVARRRVAAFMRGRRASRSAATLWLNITMLLGLVFVVGQYFAWLQVAVAGSLPADESKQFFLLCVHGRARDSRARRTGWSDPGNAEISQHDASLAPQHDGCHLVLLAFHGNAVVVLAVRFVGEAVEQEQLSGGIVSEANLPMGHGAAVMEDRPFAIPSKKLVMWLFIISDACTFGAMLFAYGYIRNAAPDWPHPFESSSIINVAADDIHSGHQQSDHADRQRARRKAGDKSGALRLDLYHRRPGTGFCALFTCANGSSLIGRGREPVPESVGIAHVRRVILRHYRTAPGSRDQRRDCT